LTVSTGRHTGRRPAFWADDESTEVSRAADDEGTGTIERVAGRTYGWDSSALVWRRVKVDENGVVQVGGLTLEGEIAAGTEYTEGDIDATITGQAIMWEDTSDTLRAVSAAKPLPVSDAGGTLTVDGTVSVTGVATAANQTTVIGHLDGVEGLLTTIDADTGNIVTSVQTLDNAISGNEMQVDVVAALPAGDNAVGRVKLTDGTDVADILDLTNSNPLVVGIVDGDGTQITSFGGGTQYTEGDTDATVTGTALLWEDTSDTLRAVSAAKPLPVGDAGGTLSIDDGGGAITVDGTVGVTGVSTAANQTTVIGHLDGVEGLLTTIDGDTGALAGTVSGSELQVDIVSAPTLTVNSHAVTNAGTFATQVDGAALTALQLIDDTIFVDDAGFTPATSKVSVIGLQADESSTDSVDEGDAGAPRMTLDRKQIVTNQPHSAGGADTFHSNDLDETEEDVKTAAGTVYGWIITNRTTAAAYIHFYNATAANVTVGTTTPLFIFAVPGNATDYVAAHVLGGVGINFGTAISVAATTDFPDDGSAAGPATNGVLCTVFYK
jgi:hypothetical protein